MDAKNILKNLLPPIWRRTIRERIVSMNVHLLHGPAAVRLANNEAVVTCVVKNGEFYIEPFIRHYSQMGFRHIFFLDNGSSDQTVAIAKNYLNVSVCSCSLPIETHQALFKKHLARKSAVGGWCLDADIDEFFDYPMSEKVALKDFLEYLNSQRYTAVATQLLDMFSDKAPTALASEQGDLTEVYRYYDLSNMTRVGYANSELVQTYARENYLSNQNTALYYGGIRKTLYGNDCLLTKHSLFFLEEDLELFPHVHFVNRARLADVSGVMRHYKLTSNALDIAIQNREGFSGNSKGYRDFIAFLTDKPDQKIERETARKFRGLRDLIESGFIFTSHEYETYAKAIVETEAVFD
jgi:Glycosyl transferase family 2